MFSPVIFFFLYSLSFQGLLDVAELSFPRLGRVSGDANIRTRNEEFSNSPDTLEEWEDEQFDMELDELDRTRESFSSSCCFSTSCYQRYDNCCIGQDQFLAYSFRFDNLVLFL